MRRMSIRSWSIRTYLAGLVALFVLAAAVSTYSVHVQTTDDARSNARSDARFAARTAAEQLGEDLATLQAAVAGLAANPQIGATFADPAGCTLAYGSSGPAGTGHIDLIRPNGVVACTSRPRGDRRITDQYATRAWLRQATRKPLFAAPRRDDRGALVALASSPVPRHGVVAGFVDLRAIGPKLAVLYGGGHPMEFLVTTGDRRSVVARSIEPRRWVGTSLASWRPPSGPGSEAHDLDGTSRYYAEARVPGAGWRLYVGEDASMILAAARRTERNQLEILLASLAAILVVTLLIYRKVALPITRLSAAVRSTRGHTQPHAVSAEGPAEVASLAADVNALLASVTAELSERRRAEAQARALAAIVESSDDAIIGKTLEGRITSWNAAAERLYGYASEEAVGRPISFLADPARRGEFPPILDRLRKGEVIQGLETQRVRKDGRVLDVSLTISPVRDGDGAIVGASTIARDITGLQEAEEQLRQAQKMEAIGRLASGVAHDFNNILMVIRTCGALLLRQLDDEDLRREVEQIDSAAERAAVLTQQLLAFGRQQVFRPEVLYLNETVEETVGLLHRLVGDEIEIVCDLDPDIEATVLDRSQLVQVILNLSLNARDAMAGGGTLTIRTASLELDELFASASAGHIAPGRYTLLQVTDTGAGIDDEVQAHIFEPFFTTKPEGTGLGLATVHGIVVQSGGHVTIYSEPGMGTTFKLYFPVPVSNAAPARPPAAGALEGSETILLVEDDAAIRPRIATTMRLCGYNVLEASSGAEALGVVEQSSDAIDLLLTDVVMPGMNGRELAERLLADRPDLSVLYTSGYPADTILRQGIGHTGTAYLEKPYLPDDLLRKLRTILDTR